jgi:uncharacterized protein (TIGR00251 family)
MKIRIHLHPASSQEKIVKLNEYKYEIWIREKPIDGKANHRLCKFLKKELGFKCKVIHGFKSKEKILDVEE